MLRFSSLFIVAASLAFAFLAVPGTGQAGGLPDGVSIEVIAEPVNLVGKWSGTWAGSMDHSVDVHITEHDGAKIDGRVVLTTQQWGVHTVDIYKGTVTGETVKITYWMGRSGNRRKNVFTLTLVDANTLTGTGQGARHTGPVSLTRDIAQGALQ